MRVGLSNIDIGLEAKIIEPEINRDASNYIRDNYRNLIGIIRGCDISAEKANDLLHDVYISIVEAEGNGNGFNMEFGSRIDEDGNIDINIMNVEQFVIGRIRLYAKNNKYRNDIVEATNGTVCVTNTYFIPKLDEHGQEIIGKDGKIKQTKQTDTQKVSVVITTCAASFNEGGEVNEKNDDLQKAYATASVSDSTDDIAEYLSLREQIDYCIEVCSLHNVNILNILKNIDTLSEMLGEHSKKKKTAESVFKQISDLADYHTDLRDAIIEIFTYASRNKAAFEEVIATY